MEDDASPEEHEILEQIELLVDLAGDAPTLDEHDLVAGLKQAGLGHTRAMRLVVFVPIAFGRAVVEQLGVRVDPNVLLNPGGGRDRVERRLVDFPEFRVARDHLPHFADRPGSRVLAILSAEVNTVNKALQAGEDVERAVLSPAVVIWEGIL